MQSDLEFLVAVRDRLVEKGWQEGSLGHSSGPNCALGAAIYTACPSAESNEFGGFIIIDGEPITNYYDMPGVVRLTQLLGFDSPLMLALFNDNSEPFGLNVMARINSAIEELTVNERELVAA